MKTYAYTYTHEGGNGDGTIEAENAKDARAKLAEIYSPTEEGDKKLKGLKFELKEVEPLVLDK